MGHLGTLDPFAEGVLPLFLGKMTKLIPHLNLSDKTYRATAVFGKKSTTLDRDGVITNVKLPKNIDSQMVEKALLGFLGTQDQVPPAYSAVKFKGKPLYKYARQNKTVTVAAKKITVYRIFDIKCEMPVVTFSLHCSAGTYIRKIAEDLAEKLGTGAYLNELVRMGCGEFFTLGNAIKLDQIENMDKIRIQEELINPRDILSDYHVLQLAKSDIQERVQHGSGVDVSEDLIEFRHPSRIGGHTLALDQEDQLIAVGVLEFSQGSFLFKPTKVLI